MKYFLSILLLFVCTAGFAQNAVPSFTLKWAPASLGLGKITIGGEYSFHSKRSIHLVVGIPATITHNIDYDGTDSDVKFKGTSVLLGFRNYLGTKNAAGLYLEPYLKYSRQEGWGLLEGRLMNEKAVFDTKAEYSGYGIGAQLGYQFVISNHFVIDLYFLGPEANLSTFKTIANDKTSNLAWTEQQAREAERDIVDVIEDVPYLGKRTDVHVDAAKKQVTLVYDGFVPSLRFGVSFGWRF